MRWKNFCASGHESWCCVDKLACTRVKRATFSWPFPTVNPFNRSRCEPRLSTHQIPEQSGGPVEQRAYTADPLQLSLRVHSLLDEIDGVAGGHEAERRQDGESDARVRDALQAAQGRNTGRCLVQ